jgi:hypothetical protein
VTLNEGPSLSFSQVEFDGLKISVDDKGAPIQWETDLTYDGLDLVCQDIDFEESRQAFYVGCTEKSATEEDPKSLVIYSIDLTTGNILNKSAKPLKDDTSSYFFATKLVLNIVHLTDQETMVVKPYLFVYDRNL